MEDQRRPTQTSASNPPSTRPVAASARRRNAQIALWLMGGLFVVAIGAALRALAPVAIPVAFALLIALMAAPLHERLQRHLPERLQWLAHLGVMALLLALVVVFLGALLFAAQRVLSTMPNISGNLQSLLPSGEGASVILSEQVRELWNTLSSSLGGWLVDLITALAQSIAGMTGVFFTTLVLVFFLVLLALTERTLWREKVQSLWPRGGQEAWSGALSILTHRLRQFLLIRSAIGLIQGALYVGWLALFGVDLLFVWAVMTFFLTYIPNLGSVVAGTLPVLYALVTKDWMTALGVAAGLLVIEQVVGNYLDPKILGRQIALSPFVILVALLFWGWLWGVSGAFLATPLTLALMVIFNHMAALRPLALILSNQRTPEELDRALATG